MEPPFSASATSQGEDIVATPLSLFPRQLLSLKGIATEPPFSTSATSQGEDIVATHLTFVSSASDYSGISSQLIDHILNTKVEKPDFDVGQLVAHIDVLLVYYGIQLRSKTTIPQEFPELSTGWDPSSFAGQLPNHAKLGENKTIIKNTLRKNLSEFSTSSVASNFADEVSKHVKLSTCQKAGCNKVTEGRTLYCKAHGGGHRCQYLGCAKSAEGKTDYCIGHGGGRRCSNEGCDRAARGRSMLCIKHGAGKRCTQEGCPRSAEGYSGLCISHGGGRRCQFPGCKKVSQGRTMYCKAHVGGKKCMVEGCHKDAEGSTPLCRGHGGGKRCLFEGGGICPKAVWGGTKFCLSHGGGRKCSVQECTKVGRGRSDFCVRHGGGKRCKMEGCGKCAQDSTDFCKRHGGGKRCLWGAEGSPYAKEVVQGKSGEIVQGPCERFAQGKTGLCAAHSALLQDERVIDMGTLAPGLFVGQASASTPKGLDASCPSTPSNHSLPQQGLRYIQSEFFVNSASASSNSIGASSAGAFIYNTQPTKHSIHQKLADLLMASEATNFVGQASRYVKRIAKEIRLYSGDKQSTILRVLNAIITIESIHWTVVGFLVLGAALEDVHTINRNKEECLKLFMSMADLSKVILQLQDLPVSKMELHSKLNKSIQLIVTGAILSRLQKQDKGFGSVFQALRDGQNHQQPSRYQDEMWDGQELQQLSRDIDDMCKSLTSHISALIMESMPSKACQKKKPTTILPAIDALTKLPKVSALHKHSLCFPETTFPRKIRKRSAYDMKIQPVVSHHRMAGLQKMNDIQRSSHLRLELFGIWSFNSANFKLNRVQLEFSRLQWLVQLDVSGADLLYNHLCGSELRFEASDSTYHPLNILPQHLRYLLSLQFLCLESSFRLGNSTINQISNAKGADTLLATQTANAPVIDPILNTKNTCKLARDQIIDLLGITVLDIEENLNEKRLRSSVVHQIANEENANSSLVDHISNKTKTDSSDVELVEMIGSNFSWSMDFSQEVLNLKNILFLPQRIGDLLGASDQNLQSIFHLPRIRDLSMLKVINLQSFICIRQQIMDFSLLKNHKMRISFHLPQHSRDLLTLNVLNLQTTLLDMSSFSLGKLETIHPIVGNKYDKLVELPEGRTVVEYKPQSMKASVQRNQHRIFLICYDWDMMKTFVNKLVKSLKAGGVNVIVIESFHWEMNDKKPLSSKQISDGANVHIPVFSKKNHLLHLQQWLCICRSNSIIRPLFCDANEDIQYLYDKALKKLAKTKDSTDVVLSSLNALPQASFLSGWSLLDYSTEWRLVKRVVFDILEMLNNLPLHLPLHAVGLEERIQDLTDKLDMESDGRKMTVAICGVGGIGKTTLAKAIFNSLGPKFQACSFVGSVKAKGLCELQEQILKDLPRKNILVKNIEHGKALMKSHLGSIRALIILDDIDHSMQLEALSVDWLAPGSRLLLISRDAELLAFADKIYQMDILKFDLSVELFSWHAFLRTYPDDGYEDRSQKIVGACRGVPCLLEVVGASLYGRTETRYWDECIRHLENTIDQDIHRRLCVSTQVLTNNEIEIFLDIACFFVGKENLETASRFWEAIGHTPNRALENLIQNSLVLINSKSHFIMHDLLQDMGRAIVADMSPDLGGRSRLWKPEDALQIIAEGLGTMSIQGISISRADRSNIAFKAESSAPMANLQLLWIDGECIDVDFLKLCPGLRWLRWNCCPLKYLPSEWSVKQLTVLDLSSDIKGSISELREFWCEGPLYKEFKYLNVLRVRSAQYLEMLPDFSIFPALRVLDLEDCPNLRSIPDSIGVLEGLKCLNISWCRNLAEVPCGISKLSSLEKLSLSHCFSLKKLPQAMEELTALKELDIGFLRNIEILPNFGKLINLKKLILAGCLSIRVLPNSIGELSNLKELDIQFLELILELPSLGSLQCLKKLIISGCESLRNIPASIGELRCLQYLEMNKCSSIDCLPEEFGKLVHLEELYMNDCPRLLKLPNTFGNLENLRILEMRHNPNLMELPSSFSELPSLVWFDASDCNLLDGLHERIGDLLPLGILNLENNFFCQLPPGICKLTNLTKLNLNNCQSLEELPFLPQGIVELDVGNCTQLIRLPYMSFLKRLRSLILCNCENLIELPELSLDQCLVVLNISRCSNIKSLSGVGGLKSLETLYFGESGVSVLELNQYIKDMPKLEEVCINANGVPWCLELKTGGHFLNDHNFTDILNYPIGNNTKCGGIFLCFVVNFMHENCDFGSPSGNPMELAILADDEAIWVAIFSNRQNVEGDQLYICMYGETHSLVRRMQAAHSITVKAKGRNIQVKECGMQLVNNGIANDNFEIFLKDLNLLAESYTSKTSKEDADEIEDDIPQRTRAELELDSGLYDYGYATSEGEYQTDEELARWQ